MAKKDSFDNPTFSEQQPKKKLSKKARFGYGLLIIFGISALSISYGQPNTNLATTSAEKVADKRDSVCTNVRVAVRMITTSFSEGKDSPQQVSLLLDSAVSDWTGAAQSATGSRLAWLNKMAEKATEVKSYILTGQPESGPESLDQLIANMSLVDQFCG